MSDIEINCDGSCANQPTDPEEYRKHLHKLFEIYPHLTHQELARRLGKSVIWLQRVLKGDTPAPDLKECKCPMLVGGGIDHVEGCNDR